MSNNLAGKSPIQSAPVPDPKEAAVAAINEHGFLLAQAIREAIRKNGQSEWEFNLGEYPVTAADGSQTKVDLVLRNRAKPSVYMALECKRPDPRFKQWLFFDSDHALHGLPIPKFFAETIRFVGHQVGDKSGVRRGLEQMQFASPIPLFNYYLESRKRKKNSEATSSTDTIEKAFQQIVRGGTGLALKLNSFKTTNPKRVVPVLVTTAEIFEAQFDGDRVPLDTGVLEDKDLTLKPLDYCAVNYHADDSLSSSRPGNYVGSGVVEDLLSFQVRTVFVVHAPAIHKFLHWANEPTTLGI